MTLYFEVSPVARAELPLKSLAVFTMNLHCFNDNWEFRFNNILQRLIEISPDVIAFQEVCENPSTHESQIAYIKNFLNQKGYPIRAVDTQFTHLAWGKDNEFIMLLSKYDVSVVDKGMLPSSVLQRGFLGFRIFDRWFINTHLEYRSDNGAYRKTQIDFLTSRYWDQPNVIMGDFNSSPDDIEQGIFRDKFYTSYFPGSTQTGNDGNSHTNIDGFWFSSTFYSGLKLVTGAILFKEKIQGQYLSDHFAVITQLNLKN
jgi:endonuclease/exonuclease/phosphatase family metal-dependent hydrolase